MRDDHHVVAPPGGRYQMAVHHQDVEYLFPERRVCSQLTLAQPGNDVSGGYAASSLTTFSRFSRSIVMVSLASSALASWSARRRMTSSRMSAMVSSAAWWVVSVKGCK